MPSDPPIEHAVPLLADEIGALPGDRGFAALCASYRATGGTARGDDLARLLEDHQCGDFAGLARLIVADEVFGFECRDTFWVPMFQFDLRDLSIKAGPRQVRAELGSEFDGWTLAAARPNSWLNDRRPVDLLDSNLPEVLGAARADRFIVTG